MAGNIMDYLQWRGDLSFERSPFNEVDNLILSELAYVTMDGIVPAEGMDSLSLWELYERYQQSGNEPAAPYNDPDPLMALAAKTERFRNMRVARYVNLVDAQRSVQFSAVTFLPEDGTMYIAFRGTDNTLVGWREDCNFSYLHQTPGQLAAARYVDSTAALFDLPLRIGGHSKGGNLAVYGGAFCSEYVRKNRILKIYSNDGPGFNHSIIDSDEYASVVEKVEKILPESSLVGILLSGEEKRRIIQSSAKGIHQHHPMTWCVLGTSFVEAESLSSVSMLMNETLERWLDTLSDEERRLFVSTVFDSIESSGAKTLEDVKSNKRAAYTAIVKAGSALPAERSREMMSLLSRLAVTGKEVFWEEAKKRFQMGAEES